MAELTSKPSPDGIFGTKAGSKSCKLESAQGSTGTSPLNPLQQLIYVRYRDHVLYNRSSALMMQPQTREAVGWLVYDCELYVILSWDRDAEPAYTSWRRPESIRVGPAKKRHFGA